MSYATTANVAAYCSNLLDGGADDFTQTSRPTKTQVTRFLSAGYSLINARLSAAGYSAPITDGTDAYDFASDLEALYAAGRAEMVRQTARTAATERTRSQMFMDQFNNGLDMLMKMDLSRAGVGHTSGLYAGGISQSNKSAIKADSDRVKPRFERDQFRHSGTARPSYTSDDEDD